MLGVSERTKRGNKLLGRRRAKDVNSKEIRWWRRKKKLSRGEAAQFAVCFDGAIKQSRGRKWTDDSLEESAWKLRKSEWRMDRVGD